MPSPCRAGLPVTAVLTRVDELLKKGPYALKHAYLHPEVRETVQLTSEGLHLNLNNVFPVKTYTDEKVRNKVLEVMNLVALYDCVRNAYREHIKRRREEKQQPDLHKAAQCNADQYDETDHEDEVD